MNASGPGGRAWLLAVLAVAAFLRAWPIEHGLPSNHLTDTDVVRSALGMAQEQDLVPPAGRHSTYPNLLPYLLLPVYAVEYAVGRATGAWDGPQAFGRALLEHPESARLSARWLVALLGVASVVVAFAALAASGLQRGALVGAWLLATSTLHVQLSVQERPWVPMLFFALLTAVLVERHRRQPRTRWLVLSCAAAGLSFSTHQVGLVALGLPALSWLTTRAPLGAGRRWCLGPAAAGLVVFVTVALLCGHPYLLRHGWGPGAGVIQGQAEPVLDLDVGGQGALLRPSLASLQRQVLALAGYEPVTCLLALLGLTAALRDRRTRWLTVYLLLLAAFLLSYPDPQPRYVLPVVAFLAWPASLAGERLVATPTGRLALGLLLLLPLVPALRLGWLLRQPDTRVAGERLLAGLPAGARVAIDHFGPQVEPDRASLELLASLRPLRARESYRLERLRSGEPCTAGAAVVRLEDLFHVEPSAGHYRVRPEARRLGDDLASVLETLGISHLLVADRHPAEGGAPHLLTLLASARSLAVVRTGRGHALPDEALLPLEMAFALTALWQVDRPGPRLELYALAE